MKFDYLVQQIIKCVSDVLGETITENNIVKCDYLIYSDVRTGRKTAEVRKDDRNYSVNEILVQVCYYPLHDRYTGQFTISEITHILRGHDAVKYGLKEGHCLISLNHIQHSVVGDIRDVAEDIKSYKVFLLEKYKQKAIDLYNKCAEIKEKTRDKCAEIKKTLINVLGNDFYQYLSSFSYICSSDEYGLTFEFFVKNKRLEICCTKNKNDGLYTFTLYKDGEVADFDCDTIDAHYRLYYEENKTDNKHIEKFKRGILYLIGEALSKQ